MKRGIMSAAIAALLVGGAMGPPDSTAEARQGESRRERQCRFQHLDPGTWTDREERLTAECVLARWPVAGGIATFNRVISCESGWNRFAYNPNGPYLGLAQHGERYWPGRVNFYMPDAWRIGPYERWRNSRTQITVTARMVNAGGWSPWTCA